MIESEPSLEKYTTEQFATFKETLTCVSDKHAADLIFKVMTNAFYDDFKEIAGSTVVKFADYFKDGEHDDRDEDSLSKSLQKFRSSLVTAPIPLTKAAVDFEHAYADAEDSEHVGKLYKQVVGRRKNRQSFSAIDYTATNAWTKGGLATSVLQRSRFMKSKGEPGKENSLLLMCAELWPNKDMFSKKDAYKHPVALVDAMKVAAKWAIASMLTNSACLFTCGRSRKVRKAFEDIVEAAVTDENKLFDGEVTYAFPAGGDPRFSKRKTFASLQNREALTALLPVPKVRMHSKPRTHYSACGEKTTHATTYSKANVRPWKNLPRLTLEDKEKMVGTQLPTFAEDMFESLKAGHPLFMTEVKEVEVYLALFEDFNVSHVFDLAAGSGAAAMAAAILGISYEGLAMNAEHANWLDRILDKAMFAIVADAHDEEAMKIKAEVNQYFNTNIDEARALMANAEEVEPDKFDENEDE